jgi:hypothetical protein
MGRSFRWLTRTATPATTKAPSRKGLPARVAEMKSLHSLTLC